jgi:hypothetical protein
VQVEARGGQYVSSREETRTLVKAWLTLATRVSAVCFLFGRNFDATSLAASWILALCFLSRSGRFLWSRSFRLAFPLAFPAFTAAAWEPCFLISACEGKYVPFWASMIWGEYNIKPAGLTKRCAKQDDLQQILLHAMRVEQGTLHACISPDFLVVEQGSDIINQPRRLGPLGDHRESGCE